MESFTDLKGNVWTFPKFTLGLVFDIRDKAGVDFLGTLKRGKDAREDAGKWFLMLYDPQHLGDVLDVIFDADFKAKGLTERDAHYLFDGEVMESARQGIIASLSFFTQPPEVAAAVKTDLPVIAKRINALLIAQWRKSSGDLLASLETSTSGLSV